MEILNTIFQFAKTVLITTFGQLVAIMGVFFFFGLILYLLARFTRVTFVKSIGLKFDIYITGWLGTPVHELGHAIFCIPFGHRITEMKLFSPNSENGTLGYVNHAYNPRNVWHRMGNFFIGFGPILFGSFVLWLLIKYLVPDNTALLSMVSAQKADLTTFAGIKNQFINLYHTGQHTFEALFTQGNINSWEFWVFLYVSLCISSHMELSPPDIKGLWSGLVSIIVLFIVVNSICLFLKVDISRWVSVLSGYSNMATGIFTFATVLSAMFFVGSWVVLNIYTLIRYRKPFHPFA